ncbi:hypothetical protein EJB05_25012, partial [Eragrostis curvula]
MASSFRVWHCLLALSLLCSVASAQLSPTFYATSCPRLEATVRATMIQAINAESRMGASLLRLFFHDCFVQGCDGSILLDGSGNEKFAGPNVNSVRGFEVIDQIKTNVEAICPGVVSCADIVALAARDGTFLLGGPIWAVPLGRRDSTTASQSQANTDLPAPTSSLSQLITAFSNKGLSARDLTALSGAHTIGFSQCQNFRDHIYNDTNIDSTFATLRRGNCPAAAGTGDSNLAPLDVTTQQTFDNAYYSNLLVRQGLLHSDQELFNGGTQDALVQQYSSNPALFASDFVTAMIKMGNISPLTGSAGQIRANCRVLGGPIWAVPLGRRDSTTASQSQANTDLPAPTSSLSQLITAFSNKGLSARDLTALSGAHTIGFSQCQNFRDHIYNDTNIDSTFATLRRGNCPAASGTGDSNLAPLDVTTQQTFDNAYYSNLLVRQGLLHSDQELFNGGSQDTLVQQYSANPALFASDFVTAMIKMGNISPLTGSAGQIRANCRVVNS